MPSLKDRHFCCPRICKNCVYIFCIEELEDDGVHDDYYCMLGLSQEELKVVSEELSNGYYSCSEGDSDKYGYSSAFKKIMGFEGYDYPEEGSRYVESSDCCNLFEYKGLLKERETEDE